MKPGRKTQQRNARSGPVKIELSFDDAMRALVRVKPDRRKQTPSQDPPADKDAP